MVKQPERDGDGERERVGESSFLRRLVGRVEPALQHNGFAITFIFTYVLANVLMFLRGCVDGWRMAEAFQESLSFRYFAAIARGGGALLNFNSAMVVLVAARSFMTFLRRTALNMIVPFDKAMPAFHSIVGNVLVLATVLHVVFQLAAYITAGLWHPRMNVNRSGMAMFVPLLVTGSMLLVVIVSMRLTSLIIMRRKRYELFWGVHTAGVTLYFSLLVVHGFHNGKARTYQYIAVPLAIYLIDFALRYFRDHTRRISISRSALRPKGDDMVCITLPRTFTYLAGQYAQVKVPSISRVEWHPFTIASSPHQSEMLFFVKKTGDWTSKLYDIASADKHSSAPNVIDICVRGPYGAPAQHVGQYEHVVLISGGVGATPFASITKYAYHWITNYTPRAANNDTSVSAAFSRNVSTCNLSVDNSRTPSAHGPFSRTPSTQGAFSRTQSGFSRTPSAQGGFSRTASGQGGFSRNASGQGGFSRTPSGQGVSRTPSAPREQFALSRVLSRNASRGMSRSNSSGSVLFRGDANASIDSTTADKASPFASLDSISRIIAEQRTVMPSADSVERIIMQQRAFDRPRTPGSRPRTPGSRPRTPQEALYSPRHHSPVPSDYVEELGNPEAPIPDRFVEVVDVSGSSSDSSLGDPDAPPPDRDNIMFQRIRSDTFGEGLQRVRSSRTPLDDSTNSSETFFSDDDDNVQVAEETVVDEEELRRLEERGISLRLSDAPQLDDWQLERNDDLSSGITFERHNINSYPFSDIDLEVGLDAGGGIRLEDEILREHNTVSNALNMLGVSYGSAAILRYLQTNGQGMKVGSQVRASMGVYNSAMIRASWQDRLMYYLHTVTVNWILLWVMIIRLFLIAIATIVTNGDHIFHSLPFAVVDLVLTVLLVAPVVTAIGVEIGCRGIKAFLVEDVGNVFEMLVLVPLLVASIVLTAYHLGTQSLSKYTMYEVLVYVVWTLTTILLLWRTARTIGSRVALAQYFKSTHSQTKSLDFIWVSKTHHDDQWLIEELLPLAGSGLVRLHRFITREGKTTEPWMLNYEKIPLRTAYERPDWDEVFSTLVERSRSDTVVGVFFCGPDRMARCVQEAAMRAMAQSVENALQRGYVARRTRTGATPADSREQLLGSSSADLLRSNSSPNPQTAAAAAATPSGVLGRVVSQGKGMMRAFSSKRQAMTDRKEKDGAAAGGGTSAADYGCNVRFSVRVENFT